MHILRPQFALNDRDALRLAADRGFGVILAADERGPLGSHVPFNLLEREDGVTILQAHLTMKNPLLKLADGKRRFLVIVQGADSYVSNDWYVSRDQVSTWLYEAVHRSGIGHLREIDANRPHGDALLADAESRLLKDPWTLASMDPVKRETMLNAIRTVDVVIDTIEGQSKLNQHKADEDHVAVAEHLAASGTEAGRTLALKMRQLRPHLRYEFGE